MKSRFLAAMALPAVLVSGPAGAMGTGAQPAIPLIHSPWGGSMSAAEQAASAAKRPAFADANWNHEVCVTAYSFEGAADDIAERKAALQTTHKLNMAEFEERRRLAALERQAARHLPNIAKCKGQFYRPALERLCDRTRGDNRFCAQLSGAALPGVELVTDKAGFVRGLAWNKVGDIYSRGAAFAPDRWRPANNRGPVLAGPSVSGIAYIAATNEAVKATDRQPLEHGIGQWAFSVEMLRQKGDELDPATIRQARKLAKSTGMTAAVGHHVQRPRLHFQAYMFDILLEGERATLAVEMRDGTRRTLGAPVRFHPVPENAPAFYTSFASYRIHAAMLPTAKEMGWMFDPKADFLTASFAMRLEDGRIDTVTLRTPLAGIAEAWQAMNAANLDVHRRIERVAEAEGS